jgi:hypothetical protein
VDWCRSEGEGAGGRACSICLQRMVVKMWWDFCEEVTSVAENKFLEDM